MIPECDLLIHSGDIGGRTTLLELMEFLEWFKKQPAKEKVWIAGNHDLCMDKEWANSPTDQVARLVRQQVYNDAMKMLEKYPEIIYLNNEVHSYNGFMIYGSPITPSFHRRNWAFNADRGEEIQKYWGRIPSEVDILITHGPPYGILDVIPDSFKETHQEDTRRGCEDLLDVIKKRLKNLKLHCFGHIHDGPTGVVIKQLTNTRWATFSNGAVIDNYYELVNINPPIINL
jgi:Icc-related predicted phosphoesterase